jgi:cytidylate kinase
VAQEGPCVIVGRCADYVLKERQDVFNIFVRAALDYRLKRVVEQYGESEKKAGEIIIKNDKSRSNYYNYHVGEKWTNLMNYDMVVRSDLMGIDKAVESICTYLGD